MLGPFIAHQRGEMASILPPTTTKSTVVSSMMAILLNGEKIAEETIKIHTEKLSIRWQNSHGLACAQDVNFIRPKWIGNLLSDIWTPVINDYVVK
jgi:hypothetical protein